MTPSHWPLRLLRRLLIYGFLAILPFYAHSSWLERAFSLPSRDLNQPEFLQALEDLSTNRLSEAKDGFQKLAREGHPEAQWNYEQIISGQEDFVWPNGSPFILPLQLEPLRLTNKAQCALDADQASPSIFLFMDSFSAGKVTNSLARILQEDPAQTSLRALREFNSAVNQLAIQLIQKILKGQLPLLDSHQLTRWAEIEALCQGQVPCQQAQEYIYQVYQAQGSLQQLQALDNFTNDLLLHTEARTSCFHVLEFSPLQEHLLSRHADNPSTDKIYASLNNSSKYLKHCLSPHPSPRFAVTQLEVLTQFADKGSLSPQKWNEVGFSFWHSFKVYLSWAWRALELNDISPEFRHVFKTIHIEQSLMMVANGCRSIEKPSCTMPYLSQQSLSALAASQTSEALDISKEMPLGPHGNFLSSAHQSLNHTSILTQETPLNTLEWLQNFRSRFLAHRAQWISRLQETQWFYQIFTDLRSLADLTTDLEESLNQTNLESSFIKDLYYMCHEYLVVYDPDVGFLYKEIIIDDLESLNPLPTPFEPSLAQNYQEDLQQLGQSLIKACQNLESTGFWQERSQDFSLKGFAPWYLERLQISSQEEDSTLPDNHNHTSTATDSAYLRIGSQPLCHNPAQCARKLLEGQVHLRTAIIYGRAFVESPSHIPSAPIFNPQAAARSCQIYDPWFHTRSSINSLFASLASSALSAITQVPLYGAIGFRQAEVTGLEPYIENGELRLEPQLQSSPPILHLYGDLSPLKIPCAVAYSNSDLPLAQVFTIGLGLGVCDSQQTNHVQMMTPADFSSDNSARSACLQCQININSSLYYLSAVGLIPSWVGTSASFASGIIQFFINLRDPENIPRLREIHLQDSWQDQHIAYEPPALCQSSPIAQDFCFPHPCQSAVTEWFRNNKGGLVETISLQTMRQNSHGQAEQIRGQVTLTSCRGQYEFWGQASAHYHSSDQCEGLRIVSLHSSGDCL